MLLSFCENEGFFFEDVGHSYQPKVKPASENWATEYQQQYNGGASWADEFAHDEASRDIVEAKEAYRLICAHNQS